MATETPQAGESGSKSSETMGASSNVSLEGTQQKCRHQLVHREAANVATQIKTQDAHLIILRKTGSSTHNKQHAIQCE